MVNEDNLYFEFSFSLSHTIIVIVIFTTTSRKQFIKRQSMILYEQNYNTKSYITTRHTLIRVYHISK